MGEEGTVGTEQIWTPVGMTLSSNSAPAAATYPALLHSDLALSRVIRLQREQQPSQQQQQKPTLHLTLHTALTHTHKNPVNPLPGTASACFYWKTCSRLKVQMWHLPCKLQPTYLSQPGNSHPRSTAPWNRGRVPGHAGAAEK